MLRRVSWLLMLPILAGPVPGCAPKNSEDIESLASRAEDDPKAVRRLVEALGSESPEVVDAAFDALVALGITAVPALRFAVDERQPYSGMALRAIGATGNPEYFKFLDACSKDPALHEDAEAAFNLAEQALWERIESNPNPNKRLCDHYLRWFEQGAHSREVRAKREQAEAWDSLQALNTTASEAQRIAFIERFPGTDAARRVRIDLAQSHLDAAVRERDAGRIDSALRAVDEARVWDADVDADSVEASVRLQLGAMLAERNDVDNAILELTRAWELGSTAAGKPLGGLLMNRGSARLSRGDLVGGVADLSLAEEVDPALSKKLSADRAQRTEELLADVRAGAPTRQAAAGALVVSSAGALEPVSDAILERLRLGDVAPLRGACEASVLVELPAPTLEWLARLLDVALASTEAQARALLGDAGRLRGLLEPTETWGQAARDARVKADAQVAGYVAAYELSWDYVESGGQLAVVLEEAPRPRQELSLLLFQGASPDDTASSLLLRAQLLAHALDSANHLDALARRDPARVAVQFIGRASMPTTLADWAVLADDAMGRSPQSAYTVPLADGSVGALRSRAESGTLVLELRTPPSARRSKDALVIDGLSALMGSARVVFAANPGVQRLEMRIGVASGQSWELSQRVTLAISRDDLATVDWAGLEGSAPFTRDSLRYVPEVRGL